jgi:uncharacterized OB-fold protein
VSDDTPERPPRAVPDPDGRNADFYRHAATGALHLQRCSDCGRYQHPPRYLCAACRSEGLEWVPVSGRGRVFSWTVTHRPIDPAWTDGPPFATLVVELAEGVRVVGALRGLPTEKLRLDLPVVAELEPVSEAFAFIHFRPEAG